MLICRESVNKFKKDIVDFLNNWVKEEVYCHKQSSWKLQNTFNNTCMKTIRVAPEKHQFINCGQLRSVQVHCAWQVNWPQSTIHLKETVLNMSIPSSKCPETPAQKVLTS